MHDNRIFFPGNPWPEGHPLQAFEWTARMRDGMVWFDFHLETKEYDAEREIESDEEGPVKPAWEEPGAWGNYSACILSSTYWEGHGFPVCSIAEYDLDYLDGLQRTVDTPPYPEDDDLAFHVYLLGHDSVADHVITFSRIAGTNRFNISWKGKVALTYAGEEEYQYTFEANIADIEAPATGATTSTNSEL